MPDAFSRAEKFVKELAAGKRTKAEADRFFAGCPKCATCNMPIVASKIIDSLQIKEEMSRFTDDLWGQWVDAIRAFGVDADFFIEHDCE